MARHEVDVEVRGPWSLATSKAFWEGFAPNALAHHEHPQRLRSCFPPRLTGAASRRKWRSTTARQGSS